MKNSDKVIIDKTAISNWEDEGGALKPVFVPENKTKNKSILLWVSGLVVIPLLYWLTKRQFQKENASRF